MSYWRVHLKGFQFHLRQQRWCHRGWTSDGNAWRSERLGDFMLQQFIGNHRSTLGLDGHDWDWCWSRCDSLNGSWDGCRWLLGHWGRQRRHLLSLDYLRQWNWGLWRTNSWRRSDDRRCSDRRCSWCCHQGLWCGVGY